jgi:hypothetical protein
MGQARESKPYWMGPKGQPITEYMDQEYRGALGLHADNTPAIHMKTGYLLKQKGDRPGALAEFQEALRVRPDYANVNRFRNPSERDIQRAIADTQ